MEGIRDVSSSYYINNSNNTGAYLLHDRRLGITGALAIGLMLIHVIWGVWLIPYFIGMFMGMGK